MFEQFSGNKPLTTKQKFVIGASIGVGVWIVVLEKRRVERIIEMSQNAVYETMMGSFDEGVKYGIETAKMFFQPDAKALKDASDYAFSAFDKK